MSYRLPLTGETWRSRVLPHVVVRVDELIGNFDNVPGRTGVRVTSGRGRTWECDIEHFARNYTISAGLPNSPTDEVVSGGIGDTGHDLTADTEPPL